MNRLGQIEALISQFRHPKDHRRFHQSLHNKAAVEVYFDHGQAILLHRVSIKREISNKRRLRHHITSA